MTGTSGYVRINIASLRRALTSRLYVLAIRQRCVLPREQVTDDEIDQEEHNES